MWQTPGGARVLRGAEADLFRVVAGMYQDGLMAVVASGEEIAPGDNRFERIPWYQQVCAIGEVAFNMLEYSEEDEPPPLLAWNELTIWSLYAYFTHTAVPSIEGVYVLRAAQEAGLVGVRRKSLKSKAELEDLTQRTLARILNPRDFTSDDVDRVRANGLSALGLRDDYFGVLFPAFSMERFMRSVVMLNEHWEDSASILLPRHLQQRFENGIDEPITMEGCEWQPY